MWNENPHQCPVDFVCSGDVNRAASQWHQPLSVLWCSSQARCEWQTARRETKSIWSEEELCLRKTVRLKPNTEHPLFKGHHAVLLKGMLIERDSKQAVIMTELLTETDSEGVMIPEDALTETGRFWRRGWLQEQTLNNLHSGDYKKIWFWRDMMTQWLREVLEELWFWRNMLTEILKKLWFWRMCWLQEQTLNSLPSRDHNKLCFWRNTQSVFFMDQISKTTSVLSTGSNLNL